MLKKLMTTVIWTASVISANAMADGLPLYKCSEKFPIGVNRVIAFVQRAAENDPEHVVKIYQQNMETRRTYFDVAVHHCAFQKFGDPALYCHDKDVGSNGEIFEREFTIFQDGHGDYHDEFNHREMSCAKVGTQD